MGAGLGGRLRDALGTALRGAGLRLPDQLAGALLSGGVAVLSCWLVAGALTAVGSPPVGAALSNSAVLSRVSGALPDRADVTRELLDTLRLPNEVVALVPATSAASPSAATVRAVAIDSSAPVVRIDATGCGTGSSDGSGFVAADGLVVTNAHVVAGSRMVTVTDSAGSHPATTVVYDPGGDVAVLRVADLATAPLTLRSTPVTNGTPAVVMGYPGGGPLTAEPAVVVQQIPVVGQRIGSSVPLVRSVYRIAGSVRPGNSGGPLLDTGGRVIGIVNARSLTDADTGYALTLGTARQDLARASDSSAAVATGTCTTNPTAVAAR